MSTFFHLVGSFFAVGAAAAYRFNRMDVVVMCGLVSVGFFMGASAEIIATAITKAKSEP